MDWQYYIDDKLVSWNTMSLEEFTNTMIPTGWEEVFEAADDILPEISRELQKYAKKHIIYPPMHLVFNPLESLRPQDIKVVLIGQDPYINPGEAMGLSFSVPEGVKIPPSLRNIFKELVNEGYPEYHDRTNGDLTDWVSKGVFLYNTCLTVNKGMSGSHKNLWDDFTNLVINYLKQRKHIAWILLGAKAQKYAEGIDRDNHGIFMAGHPSPLNRNGDFAGSDVFTEAEDYLQDHGIEFTW